MITVLKNNKSYNYDRNKIIRAITQAYNQISIPDFKKIDIIMEDIENEIRNQSPFLLVLLFFCSSFSSPVFIIIKDVSISTKPIILQYFFFLSFIFRPKSLWIEPSLLLNNISPTPISGISLSLSVIK